MDIRVEGLVKRFGQFTALDQVTLDFPSGELVAFGLRVPYQDQKWEVGVDQ